jgi:hypothetical protein
MRFTYAQVWILVLAIHLVIPFFLIVWTWRKNYHSSVTWFLQALLLASYTAFVFLMGSWMFAGFYLRYLVLLLSIAAIMRSFFKIKAVPGTVSWFGNGVRLLLSLAFLYLVVGSVRAHFYDEVPLSLSFPYKNGIYAVFEEGNGRASSLMNYHYRSSAHKGANTNRAMKLAVDVTKLSMWGNDANGILPRDNAKYAIFGKTLYSPCDGEVFEVVDKWPNETPFTGKPPYNVGNQVVIKSGTYCVLMGHFQKGSITVKAGDRVTRGATSCESR